MTSHRGIKRNANEKPKSTLKKIDIAKPSFIVMKSYSGNGYQSGDNPRQFLTKSHVLVYSDSDEADEALEEFFETGKLRKKLKRKKTKSVPEENYEKILYYSDEEADTEAREILDSSSDDCSDKLFSRAKKA